MSTPKDTYRLVVLHDIMGAEVAVPIHRILDVEACSLPEGGPQGAEAAARLTAAPVPGKKDVIEYVVRETPARVAKLVSATLNGWAP